MNVLKWRLNQTKKERKKNSNAKKMTFYINQLSSASLHFSVVRFRVSLSCFRNSNRGGFVENFKRKLETNVAI